MVAAPNPKEFGTELCGYGDMIRACSGLIEAIPNRLCGAGHSEDTDR